MRQIACKELVNQQLYPIDQPGNPKLAETISTIRASLGTDGCAVIPNFLSEAGLKELLAEATERKAQAYYSKNKACNVYLGNGNPEQPDNHPQNVFLERTNGIVPADTYGENTLSHQLYFWPPLMKFLANCLDKTELFIYEDPVSNMIVNVARTGQQFNWHFDTNEFTITMLLQAAESGGHFEYVPNLRNATDECYPQVKQVLDGERNRVKRLTLAAGDLQLFLGRYSLHRVTKNAGDTDRLLLIMSFAEIPGMVGNRVRVKDLYGKVSDVHTEKNVVRSDELLD